MRVRVDLDQEEDRRLALGDGLHRVAVTLSSGGSGGSSRLKSRRSWSRSRSDTAWKSSTMLAIGSGRSPWLTARSCHALLASPSRRSSAPTAASAHPGSSRRGPAPTLLAWTTPTPTSTRARSPVSSTGVTAGAPRAPAGRADPAAALRPRALLDVPCPTPRSPARPPPSAGSRPSRAASATRPRRAVVAVRRHARASGPRRGLPRRRVRRRQDAPAGLAVARRRRARRRSARSSSYTHLVGALGFGRRVERLSRFRAACASTSSSSTTRATPCCVAAARASWSTPACGSRRRRTRCPDALGEGRFAAQDFLREIQGLAARFDVVRIEGPDYRHRGLPPRPPPLPTTRSRAAAARTPGRHPRRLRRAVRAPRAGAPAGTAH